MASDVLRTPEMLVTYRAHRKQLGADLPKKDLLTLPLVREYGYWKLVQNEFPYDKIARSHCLLVPKRLFVHDSEMEMIEREELFKIKAEMADSREFDSILENLAHNRTVPGQYHLHCIKFHHITPLQELS